MEDLSVKSKKLISWVNTEHLILLVFLSLSTYFLIGSFDYSQRANVFPRLTSSVTMIGTLLLIFKNYLPAPLKRLSGESVDLTERFASEAEATDDGVSETNTVDQASQPVSSALPNGFVTGALVLLFILFGHLIGLLWVTPLFIAIYTLWFGMRWYYIVLLSLTGFAIAYIFNTLLILSLQEGIVTGMVVVYA